MKDGIDPRILVIMYGGLFTVNTATLLGRDDASMIVSGIFLLGMFWHLVKWHRSRSQG